MQRKKDTYALILFGGYVPLSWDCYKISCHPHISIFFFNMYSVEQKYTCQVSDIKLAPVALLPNARTLHIVISRVFVYLRIIPLCF